MISFCIIRLVSASTKLDDKTSNKKKKSIDPIFESLILNVTSYLFFSDSVLTDAF